MSTAIMNTKLYASFSVISLANLKIFVVVKVKETFGDEVKMPQR